MRSECLFLESVASFIEAKTIVEIGVATGEVSIHLARVAQNNGGKYFGFDLWSQHGQVNQFPATGSKVEVEKRLKDIGLSCFQLTQINTIDQRELFENLLDSNCPNGIDFCFIDACHSYKGIANDFIAAYPRLSKTGIIAFHDTAKIDGCREFVLDLRTKFHDGSYDIIDLPFGAEERHCGVTLLVKRMLPVTNLAIDEICGSISLPKVIEQNEVKWLSKEMLNKPESHKAIPKIIEMTTLDKVSDVCYGREKFS